jgi:hypothetical protein
MATIDEETERDSAASAGAPVNRDARPDARVIEIAARGTSESEPAPAEGAARPGPAPAAGLSRTGGRGYLGGALAGLVVSALGIGAGYILLSSKADAPETANRLNAIEAQAQRENAALAADLSRNRDAVAGLEKRVSALEVGASAPGAADLEKRVVALEAAKAGNSGASARLAAQEKDLRADIDTERGATSDLTTRVAKLETDTQKANAASADLAALAARVDKIETALAAPKTETRSASDTAAAIAIIAEAAEGRLRAGEPLGPDVAALQHLGVDAAALAALQPVVSGATANNAALAASFSAVAPQVLAATSQKGAGSVTDRFLAHLRSLVRVRDLKETAGDDPPALVSQIEAETRRGDLGGALASFNKLPEAARQAAGDWPRLARARQAADSALQSIREAAIGQLAGGLKP